MRPAAVSRRTHIDYKNHVVVGKYIARRHYKIAYRFRWSLWVSTTPVQVSVAGCGRAYIVARVPQHASRCLLSTIGAPCCHSLDRSFRAVLLARLRLLLHLPTSVVVTDVFPADGTAPSGGGAAARGQSKTSNKTGKEDNERWGTLEPVSDEHRGACARSSRCSHKNIQSPQKSRLR